MLRKLVLLGAVLVVVYLYLVPQFWTAPKIIVNAPTTSAANEDIPIKIMLVGWNANNVITRVYFHQEQVIATAAGGAVTGSLPDLDIYLQEKVSSWPAKIKTRITRFYTQNLTLNIPIKDVIDKAPEAKMPIKGEIVAVVDYLDLKHVKKIPGQDNYPTREYIFRRPVNITIYY